MRLVYAECMNDNDNFAASIFRSLCEFVGDCFGPRVIFFGSYAPSEKYLGPKQSPPILHNDHKIDGGQLLLSKYGSIYHRSCRHFMWMWQ